VRPKTIRKSVAIRSLKDVLSRIPDRRRAAGRRHPLVAILMLVTVGMMCGARGQRGIAAWGRELPQKVRRALGFRRRRSPAHSTIHEVMKTLDVEAFEAALREWAKGLTGADRKGLRGVALDGKTSRGSGGKDLPGLHVLTAFDVGSGVVLASTSTEGKGGEPGAALALLPAIPLEGAVLTGDAGLTHKRLCCAVKEGGGDYLLVVKDNQPDLRRAIEEAFEAPHSPL
jgi:hypothetical protein